MATGDAAMSERMTKADELNALADRCEREEGSWRLTCEIEAAITGATLRDDMVHLGVPIWLEDFDKPAGRKQWRPQAYTTSLDAAVTLVPEGWAWLHSSFDVMTCVKLTEDDKEWPPRVHGTGRALPMALCAAALRARAAVSHEDPGAMRSERSERATSNPNIRTP
jgi:hypothetical protein